MNSWDANFDNCDIILKFKQFPPDDERWFGVEYSYPDGKSNIEIYFAQHGTCVYDDGEYYGYYGCINETDYRTTKQLGTTIRHEIGHALGLGHYISDNEKLNVEWSKGSTFAPSIMVQFHYGFEELQEIMPQDIEEITKMYGREGFNFDSWNPNPTVSTSQITNMHIVSNQETKIISGVIPDELYKRGVLLEILIQKPNGVIETEATSVSKTYHNYQHELIFDQDSQIGMYEISLKFDGEIFQIIPINISKEYSNNQFNNYENKPVTPKENFKSGIDSISFSGVEDEITYNMIGGTIQNIIPDINANSLIISVNSFKDGSLTIAIPRTILDATINENDDDFFVLVDDEVGLYDETKSDLSRALTISVPEGAEEIEIIGTFVIPEFGSIAMLILVASIIAVIVSARKFQFSCLE
jgi:predicted secreted protein with PEFG-CTERM motif